MSRTLVSLDPAMRLVKWDACTIPSLAASLPFVTNISYEKLSGFLVKLAFELDIDQETLVCSNGIRVTNNGLYRPLNQ